MGPAPPQRGDNAAGHPSDDPERATDSSSAAYHQRTLEVHEARSALAEAVHTLRLELAALHQEHNELRDQYDKLEKEWKALGAEVEWSREQRTQLEQELQRIRNMRAVRWSARLQRTMRRSRGQP